MARLKVSIVFESGARMGPGKARLLESIRDIVLIGGLLAASVPYGYLIALVAGTALYYLVGRRITTLGT